LDDLETIFYEAQSGTLRGVLRDFSARPGLEGPQVVVSWSAPADPVQRIRVVRQVGRYPRTPWDGVEIFDASTGIAEAVTVLDVADDLVGDPAQGAGRWWYYRAFILPAPLPLAAQPGMLQELLDGAEHVPVDVQEFGTIGIRVLSLRDADDIVATLLTAPTADGPWIVSQGMTVPPGEERYFEMPGAGGNHYKWVRVSLDLSDARVAITPVIVQAWCTSLELSQACYAFRTGRHLRLAWELGHLPKLYLTADADQGSMLLFEGEAAGELRHLGENGHDRGPLYRFLRMLLLELDRVQAYQQALCSWTTHPEEMPRDVLQHITTELGFAAEMEQDLEQSREQLFRIAGMWKRKGTVGLLESVCEQVLGCAVRVQTGAGRVFRVADPSLFD